MSTSVDDNVIRPREFERVFVTIHVGQVPAPHEYQGKYVVTLQVAPIERGEDAHEVKRLLTRMLERRGLKFPTGDAKDAVDATSARIIALADRRRAPRPAFTYAQAMTGQGVKTGARAFDAIAFLERQFRQTR
jgi:hypothetical protein